MEFRTIPGFESYEISRDGIVRRRLSHGLRYAAGREVRRIGQRVTLNGRPRLPIVSLIADAFGIESHDLLDAHALPGEEWRPVLEHEAHYEVSSVGRVRRISLGYGTKPGRILRPFNHRRQNSPGKYDPTVALCGDGQRKTMRISRLVAGAFHGAPPSATAQANHKNGDTMNNSVENIEWSSPSDNSIHAVRTGLRKAHHANARMAADTVRAIRALEGRMLADKVAGEFGVSSNTIRRIWQGVFYKHIP